ncbi:MAG: heavy-metal-associated domain-containing protein [Cytophagales bacterium]|nr:heavy-metal-associated domain-containing protein [Cytophagales bacterium]
MKTLIYTFLSAALVCGCNCKSAFAQNQDKPFGVATTKMIDLKVSGMTCQGCADHITTALTEKKGVVKSEVSFASNSASITYDSTLLNEAEIIKTIEAARYKAGAKDSKKLQDDKSAANGTLSACCVPKKKN